MPTILTINGYRFHFYMSDRSEPAHVHVSRGNGYAKIWLVPNVEVQYFYGYKLQEQREILEITLNDAEFLKAKWNEYFGK
jgi:hypothetical protein